MRQETFKFKDLVCLILETWRYYQIFIWRGRWSLDEICHLKLAISWIDADLIMLIWSESLQTNLNDTWIKIQDFQENLFENDSYSMAFVYKLECVDGTCV